VQDKSSRGRCKRKCQGRVAKVRGARARRHGKGARLKHQRKVQDKMAGERCKRQSATC
jgi:hypothetical protein